MQLISLNRDSFFRRYENIGYLYNQRTKNEMILDDVGALYLSNINREPQPYNEIVKNLASYFNEVCLTELRKDFIDFMWNLECEGFITIDSKIKEEFEEDSAIFQDHYSFSNKNNGDKSTELKDSNELLISHLNKYPRPFRAHIELVKHCNLRCLHCYIPSENKIVKLPVDSVISFLDQLADMGTMEVIFTGGEPLLHDELILILDYARKKDFSIILLTNGTKFNESLISALRRINVALVQVSLYSMDPAVHDEITNVAGSWDRTFNNINKLIQNGIKVEIACPILKENESTFKSVIEYGLDMGICVTNDLAIMAQENFVQDNIEHRVGISHIKDIVSTRNMTNLNQNEQNVRHKRPCIEDPVCGMGRSLICLSANGDIIPCPGFRIPLGNINDDTLVDIWEKSANINFIRSLNFSAFTTCLKCEYIDYCNICPAKFFNESTGDVSKICSYFCEIAKSEKQYYEH